MTNDSPKVSVIIPHWNGIEIISECLDSLAKTQFDSYEVIVSDNASTDGSQKWLKENHPEVRLLENSKNYGYAGGCNRGSEIARGTFLLFLNNDTIQDLSWLEHLVKRIEINNEIAAVQPKILNYFDNEIFDYAGGSGGHMDLLCYPFARGRLFLEQEKDKGQYDNAVQCFWTSGTAMLVKKDLFIQAGKFDEVFFAHMEEIDLCWRVKRCGYRIECHPSARVYHVGGGSLDRGSPRKTYLNFRNNMRMLVMNLSGAELIWKLPLRWSLDLVAALKDLLGGRTSMASAAFRGSSAIIPTLGHWLSERKQSRQVVEANRIKADRSRQKGWYSGVLIVDYFLKGKKKWSDL